jgi:hypothetical protein
VRHLKYLVLLAALVLPAAYSQAQVAIGVQIGPTYGIYNAPPVCEYGFYPNYPFACAPYGYWGPQWFADGVFIGAGPWNHFYFTHAGFYRPFYVNQGFGFRGGDRFRSFGNGGRGFREGGGQTFRNGGGQTFRGDSARGGFRGNGGQSFRDGGGSGVRSGGGRGFSGSSGQSRSSSGQSRGSSSQSRGGGGGRSQSHGSGGQSRGGGGDHGGHR